MTNKEFVDEVKGRLNAPPTSPILHIHNSPEEGEKCIAVLIEVDYLSKLFDLEAKLATLKAEKLAYFPKHLERQSYEKKIAAVKEELVNLWMHHGHIVPGEDEDENS